MEKLSDHPAIGDLPALHALVGKYDAIYHLLQGLNDEFLPCAATGRLDAWAEAATAIIKLAVSRAPDFVPRSSIDDAGRSCPQCTRGRDMSATCPNCGALAGDWRKIGATLAADLNTAEDALVSQTALVRSQAERIASLEAAGRALVDRWDTPNWKVATHTGEFISRLRDLLPDNQSKEG